MASVTVAAEPLNLEPFNSSITVAAEPLNLEPFDGFSYCSGRAAQSRTL